MKKCIGATSLIVALLLGLASCASLNSREPLTPKQVGTNELIIVGSVSFSPEILYDKPKTTTDSAGKKQVQLTVSNDPLIMFSIAKESFISRGDLGALNESYYFTYVKQHEQFIIKTASGNPIFLKGFGLVVDDSYLMNSGRVSQDKYILAGDYTKKFKIDVPSGARAVYIGAFVLNRDENYEVTTYEINDDYDKAKAEFTARFPGYVLVRADVTDLQQAR